MQAENPVLDVYSQQPIIEPIRYYTIESTSASSFTYIGSDYDFFVAQENRARLLRYFINNDPQEFERQQAKYFNQCGHAYQQRGENDRAEAYFNLVLQSNNQAEIALARLQLAHLYFARHEYEEVEALLAKAAQQNENEQVQRDAQYFQRYLAQYYGQRAARADEENELLIAKRYYKLATKQNYDRARQANAHVLLGDLYCSENRLLLAEASYERAKQQKDDLTAKYAACERLTNQYLAQKKCELAKQSLKPCIAQNQNLRLKAWAHHTLGTVYYSQNRPGLAKHHWSAAAEQTDNPTVRAHAFYNLGLYCINSGLITEGKMWLNKAQKSNVGAVQRLAQQQLKWMIELKTN